jgi:site-specific DNA-methyltransferase (adenine-specific)
MLDTIVHGDCLQVLPTIASESIPFVLTDPPYLTRYAERGGRKIANDDNNAWLRPGFAELYRVLAKDSYAVSFYGWPHADRFVGVWRSVGFRIAGHFVFPKGYVSNSSGHVGYQHECAYLLAKGSPRPQQLIPDVLPWKYTENRLHPTQKPLCALQPLIAAFSAPGAVVLDPFAGSGSTLIAARKLGRHFIGIEIDPAYHAVASARLARRARRPESGPDRNPCTP